MLKEGKWKTSCSGPIQANLRYNMSGRPIPDGLPVQDPKETLADAICCDSVYHGYAETSGTFALPTVNLFEKMNKDGELGRPEVLIDLLCFIHFQNTMFERGDRVMGAVKDMWP